MGELNEAGVCVIPAYFLFYITPAVDKKKALLSLVVTAITCIIKIRHH